MKGVLFLGVLLAVACTTRGDWMCTENLSCRDDETCLPNVAGTGYVCVNSSLDCGCDWAREWCRGVDSQSVTCVCQYGGSPGDCAYPPGPYCYGVYCAYGESCYSTSPSNEQYQCVNQTAAGRTCQECWSETSDCYANPGDNTDVHCGCKHSGSYPDCTGVPCGAGFCSAGQQCLPVKDAEDVMVCVNSSLVQENCFCYEFSACYAIYSGTSDPVPACACSIGGSYPECYTQVCGGSFCLSDEVCAQDVGGSSSADRCVNSTKYYEICNSCYNYGSSCGSYNGDKDDIRCICQYGGVSPNCSTPCGSGICSYDFICLGTEQWDSLCVSKTTVEEACHNCTADFSHCVAVAGQPNTAQCKCQYGGTYPSCLGTPCDGDHCTSEERCVQTKNQKSACVSLVEYNSCSNDCNFDGAGCFAVTTPTGPTTVSCQCQYSGTPGSCTGEKCGDVYCSIQESCFKNNNNEAPLCVDQNEISECQACYENGNSYCAAVAGNPNYVECRCYYGTYPNCVLPCGDANCTGSEHCIQQFQEDGEDYKMPLCVDEGNLNCNCESQLAECHAVPGTPNVAQCGCRFGGTYPNCLGQPCGNTHCGAMEYCFQNAVDNAQPVCVGYEHINCQPCNNWPSDSYCVGFVGTPDNFAQCKCIKPNPQNPSQCLPVACPRPGDEWPTMCNGTTKSCQNNPENDGKLECLCAPGLKMSRLTRECEERPILDPCVPCSSGVPRSQCGCAAGQTCEVPFVGAQGHCICAPGMVAYQDRDEGSVQCKPVAPPVSTAPATCIAGGDPHYMTFDKRFFDFQDRCDFVLVKSDNFEVHIRHGECASGTPNPTVSCTKAIAFLLPQDHVAEIAPGVATLIDNAPAPDFPFTAHGVEFKTFTYMEMEGIRVSFPDGAQIELFAYSVSVSLPPSSQYYGQVRGLCGDFNGNPVNDYTGRDEVVSSVAVVSARTWVVSNETDLVLFSEPNFGCADSYPVPADINELCPNNEYRDCGAMEKLPQDCWDYFDILKFYEICIYDNCQFNTSDAQFFVMPAWLRLCHRESLYRSLKCEPPCASDETCRINIETNSTTCIEKDVNVCPLCGDHQVCSITVSGDQQTGRCVCEEGFKPSQLDSSICVEEATCADVICDRVNEACLATDGANGQLQYTCQCIAGTVRNIISGACEFPANVTALGRCKTCQNGPDCGCSSPHQICAPEGRNSFYGTCVCEVGYSLNETSGLCQLIIIVPVPTPAVCQGYGDPHYTTFDNLYWHYQPKCDVYGVLGNGMNIQIRQGECWPQFGQNAFVSCVKAVAFTTPAPVHTIEFSDQHAAFYPNVDVLPSIWVDGVNQTSFPLTVSGVVITASANFQSMTATFPDGSSVSLSRYFSLSVVLPPVYMNNVTGICGNFNGDGTDGQDGDQYLVADGDELFRYANPDCYDKKRATTPTLRSGGSDSDPNCQVKAVQACAPLKAIQQTYPNCAQLVDMAPFIVSCVYDYCALGDAVPAMINASIDALKSRCEQKEQIYNNYLVSVTTGVVSTGEASTAGSGAVEMSTGNTNAQVTIVTLVVMLIVAFVL